MAAQEIYGPHDGRQWSAGPIAMGRRLFRTLPEDIHDSQPLQSRDGRLTLVADVRLDNRDELAADLGLNLADAAKLCDAAILLTALERWGEGALDRVVGEFAFALWDAHAQKLTLARDFLGQRPLQLLLISVEPPHHRPPPPSITLIAGESRFADNFNGLLQQNRPKADIGRYGP